MPCGQVTLGAGTNTQLQSQNQRAMQVVIQNNSSTGSYIRVGDDVRVSFTSQYVGFGILIPPGASTANFGAFTSGAQQLTKIYIAGGVGLVVDYQYTPED